jgi:hypothetical protein
VANKSEIFECLELLSGAFPEQVISAKMTRSYAAGLEDVDGKLLLQAAVEITKDMSRKSHYFPRIAEIRRQVKTVEERLRSQPARIKQDAWCMVRDRLFVEFWGLHPGDYPGFDGDFQRFALKRMPADLLRLEPKC